MGKDIYVAATITSVSVTGASARKMKGRMRIEED
jgi:hypothetical protein